MPRLGACTRRGFGAGRPSHIFICGTCCLFSSRARCHRAPLRSSWPSSTQRPPASGERVGTLTEVGAVLAALGLWVRESTCSRGRARNPVGAALTVLWRSRASVRPVPAPAAAGVLCRVAVPRFSHFCASCWQLPCPHVLACGRPQHRKAGLCPGGLQPGRSHRGVCGRERHTVFQEVSRKAGRTLVVDENTAAGAGRDPSPLSPRGREFGVCTERGCRDQSPACAREHTRDFKGSCHGSRRLSSWPPFLPLSE